MIKVEGNLHFIDKWEGEQVWVLVDGEVAWMKQMKQNVDFKSFCGND